jgi:hypothetical protein
MKRDLDLAKISPDDPLRLDIAARLAFPDGSMKKSGLRREIQRGRLDCWNIAGKQYTTLNAITRMRAKCLVAPKAPVSTSANDAGAKASGSSSTDKTKSALAAAQMIAAALKKPSPSTSSESTNQTGKILILQK